MSEHISSKHKNFFLEGGNFFKLPLLILLMLALAGTAFAAHTPSISLTPDMTNCDTPGKTFTVNVANSAASTDSILQVEIYKATTGISSFTCGSAPDGWTLFTYTDRCIYVTELNSPNKITPGFAKDFTFDAIMQFTEACASSFTIVTVDDEGTVGQRVTTKKNVSIDCTAPKIDKTVGDPKITGTDVNWWITQATNINVAASDNTDKCDLGLDYCRYTYTVDGNPDAGFAAECAIFGGTYYVDDSATGWCKFKNGGTLNFNFLFNEDSMHKVKIECYDIVGNKTEITESERVDGTPPQTRKWYEPAAFFNNCPCWFDGTCEFINLDTEIHMNAVDPDPTGQSCNIGVKKTYWYNTVFEGECNNPCEDPKQCRICEDGDREGTCVPGIEIGDDRWEEYTGSFKKQEESCHALLFYSVDELGNTEDVNIQCFYVDARPPVVDKQIGNPTIEGFDASLTDTKGVFHWVTPKTDITFTCEDQQPHPSRAEELCYKVSYDMPNWGYVTDKYCDTALQDGYCCVSATIDNPFVFNFHANEDSLHNLEYFCMDGTGNKSMEQKQYYRVDSTPPEINKTMLGIAGLDYLGDCPPTSPDQNCYVADNGRGRVQIAVSDPDPTDMGCNVDQTTCTYELLWEATVEECKEADGLSHDGVNCLLEEGRFGEDGKEILFHEDSKHTLIVNCEDALGNSMLEDTEVFLVDSTPPVTTKTYGDPHYPATIVEGQPHWITTQTSINMTAEDEKVGVDYTKYRVLLINNDQAAYSICGDPANNCNEKAYGPVSDEAAPWTKYSAPFNMDEESCHVIEYYSVDLLGNTELTRSQCVFVEDTPPVVTKTIGDPKVVIGDKTYISQKTPITLRCMDIDPHPVDNVSMEYRYRVSDDCASWGDWTKWQAVAGDILFTEDSCHELEYYCEDALGNVTVVYSEIDVVDTQGPEIKKTIVGPQYGDCPPQSETDNCYIDGVTEIHVDAKDPDPHPVNTVTCDWYYEVMNDSGITGGKKGVTPPFVINFPEESRHALTITCYDALGNGTKDYEEFIVDKTPPAISKDYKGPFFATDGKEWINSLTEIYISAKDQDPHPSGLASLEYRISLVDDSFCANQDVCQDAQGTGNWAPVTGVINIPEQSCHLIEITAVDNVEKTANHKQCVFVDNTPPTPLKTVGEPKDMWTPGLNGDPASYFYPEETLRCWNNEADELECWQATVLTPIIMDCNDPLPHPVDNGKVCFNVELDGEDKTENYCNRYNGRMNEGFCCLEKTIEDFYFMENSEHNLKYYCVDALGNSNKDDLDEEKFKIEGTKFEIPLFKKWNLISVPFKLLNDSPQEVFKETEGIDRVWTYDPAHELCGEDWCVYSPDGEAGNDNLPSITPGWGYWVMEKNDEEWVTLGGSLFQTGPSAPLNRSLVPGWNLVGYYGSNWQMYDWGDFDFVCGDAFRFPDRFLYGDKVYCSLNSLVDTQEGYPRWSSLWSYINCGNHHDAWLPLETCAGSGPDCLSRMYAGRGYWVEMDVADNYAPATNCIWNSDFQCVSTMGGIQA